MKEQDMVMARDLNKTVKSSMTNGEFKAIIIRILTGLKKRMEDISETLTMGVPE